MKLQLSALIAQRAMSIMPISNFRVGGRETAPQSLIVFILKPQ